MHNKISFAIMEIFLWLKKKPQKGGSAVRIARLCDVAKVIVIFFEWSVVLHFRFAFFFSIKIMWLHHTCYKVLIAFVTNGKNKNIEKFHREMCSAYFVVRQIIRNLEVLLKLIKECNI